MYNLFFLLIYDCTVFLEDMQCAFIYRLVIESQVEQKQLLERD